MYAHARAPIRIGIAGGGTDLPAWTKSGRVGRCLSLALKTYTHAVAISRPDGRVVASYSQRDEAAASTEIANGLIRESALMHGFEDAYEVHILPEVSSRGTGLGVSSSIAVALAACFRRLSWLRRGHTAEPKWSDGGDAHFRDQVACSAWTVEIDKLRRPIGRQDHAAATYGGLRLYRFEGDGASIERSFTSDDAEWVAEHLALVALPDGHDARTILAQVKDPAVLEMSVLALANALEAVEKKDLRALGMALRKGQSAKRDIPGAVPLPVLALMDKIEASQDFYGCKIAGAGGGGHLVVACKPEQHRWLERLTQLPVIKVEPDFEGVRSEGWA